MGEFIHCPQCSGSGQAEGKECSECRGIGIFFLHGKYLFFWGKVIDDAHIILRRLANYFRNFVDFLLLLFGTAGIFLIFWEIFFETSEYSLQTFLSMWNSRDPKIFIFWLTVISDSYLFYRFFRRLEWPSPLPKEFQFDANGKPKTTPKWEEVKSSHSAKKIDIAKMFSNDALLAIERSYEAAKNLHHGIIHPLHLFFALLRDREIVNVFLRLGIPFSSLKNKISRILSSFNFPQFQGVFFGNETRQALLFAFEHGIRERKKRIDTTDILFGVIKSSEIISNILYDFDVDPVKIANVSLWSRFQKNLMARVKRVRSRGSLRSKTGMNRTMTAIATPLLDAFSDDLTHQAKLGYLEPCIGREKEIEEIFEILSGGTKGNAVIVGDPGVGKRSIISGIAQLMVSEDVPGFLRDRRLVSISVSRLVSGAAASQAEERLLGIFEEVMRSENIILCIQNIAHLIGISSGSSSSMDLAGVLAETLSKKLIRVIATSTSEDYIQYIENSGALGEVLEKVEIKEVEKNTAIQILESKAGMIEYKYGVFFTYDALVNAVELTHRYLHDRYLPEKAIEILEETASHNARAKGGEAVITANNIAEIISQKTEIPLTNLSADESEKLLNLEELIHERMVNQNEAVSMAASALRRARAEVRDEKRPIVNLLFLGPTGVGKTQLAKTISQVYFGGEGKMIRLDMSEYQEKSSVYRLIGFPSGPQGRASEGYLTEQVRHHPFSLLLLDEIEKAHPDILNVFLQVMDDARITDAKGRVIDFTNVILICTSNAGTKTIQKRILEGITPKEIKEELLNQELMDYFKPEFLNRFDGIVVFKPLSRDEILKIAELLLNHVAKELEKKGIQLEITSGALRELAELGFDPIYGARPMRRVIQDKVDNVIAEYILEGKLGRRDRIIFDMGGKAEIVKPKKL